MKKMITILIVFLYCFSFSVCAEEIYDISIELNIGKNTAFVNRGITVIDKNQDVVPFIENGRTMVPLRFIAENLKLDVEWIQDTQNIILTASDTEIILEIGDDAAFINGNLYQLDCVPVIFNDRTFVPVRFISEALQCTVAWQEANQQVTVLREKETELDINNEEVQKLFSDVLNQNEFASYYAGYCDVALWDNPHNMFGGTMRELFSLISFEGFQENQYTQSEANNIISDFLSYGDTGKSLSNPGIDSLRYGSDYGSDSEYEILVAVYDGEAFHNVCFDLFGEMLPKHENLAYSIAYHAFHLYNRVNLFCPYGETLAYNVYYNAASDQYLFTKYATEYMNFYDAEELPSETKLLKATKHNGKISLYLEHTAEFDEYSGGKSTYSGIYKNTYQKGPDGYYWISSYGIDITNDIE